MKKILSIVLLLILSLNTTLTYANTANGNYIIINNQSTDPYNTQSTGKINNTSNNLTNQIKLQTPYGIDKVIPIEENAQLYNNTDTQKTKINLQTREFTTVNFKTNTKEKICADLKYSSKKANIWVHENQISEASNKNRK